MTSGITSFIPLVTHGGPEGDGSNVDANWLLGINDGTDVLAADFEDMATGLNHPVSGTTVLANDVWYHGAATYDGSDLASLSERQSRGDPRRRGVHAAGAIRPSTPASGSC